LVRQKKANNDVSEFQESGGVERDEGKTLIERRPAEEAYGEALSADSRRLDGRTKGEAGAALRPWIFTADQETPVEEPTTMKMNVNKKRSPGRAGSKKGLVKRESETTKAMYGRCRRRGREGSLGFREPRNSAVSSQGVYSRRNSAAID